MNDFVAHILVVDDDEGIRSLIKQYLNENNFLVTTSDSAENAEEKIFDEIFSTQKKRIYNALLNSSSDQVLNFDNVLKKIINE